MMLKQNIAVIVNFINVAEEFEQQIFQDSLFSGSIFYCYILYNYKMNCISESEIDGECVDKLLKESIKDIQTGLCNTEMAILRLVDNDEINPDLWLASYECNIQLINLVKDLNIERN